MSKLLKKLIVSIVAVIYLFTVTATPAHAQSQSFAPGPWYSQNFFQWYSKVYDGSSPAEMFGERYTAAQVQWVFYGFFSFVLNTAVTYKGCSPEAVAKVFSGDSSGFITGCSTASSSALPTSDQNLLSAVFAERPVSAITYFKDLGRKFHIVPEAQAQGRPGFGYSALEPIRQLWQATRNISYSLFIIVILALAFMIMFRVKTSPQTAISVQSALPKIAVALVLVAFSYAIAGFFIDLMYVMIGFISLIFSSTGFFNSNPATLFNLFTTGFEGSGIFGFLILYLVQFVTTFLTVAIVGALDGSFGGLVLGALSILLAVILLVVMILVLLWISIKILITLIKAFAYIMFLTIILPLQVTIGVVVPNIGFGSWVRLYIANLAVFPITAVLFGLSFIFMEQARKFVESKVPLSSLGQIVNVQTVPSVNPGWPPLLGVGTSAMGLLFLIASFFILALIPKAAEIANGLVTGKFAFGNAFGEATNPFGARGLATETLGTFLGNQLYNPRGAGGEGSGVFFDILSRMRSGTGRPRAQGAGTAGGGPTTSET